MTSKIERFLEAHVEAQAAYSEGQTLLKPGSETDILGRIKEIASGFPLICFREMDITLAEFDVLHAKLHDMLDEEGAKE